MKRPKIADMTPLERGRFRLLQAFRGARRNLDDLKYIDEAELPPDEIGKLHKFRREMQTIVMAIPPRKTQNADVHAVKMMLEFVWRITGDDRDRKGMN